MIPLLVELSSVPAVKSIVSILTDNEIDIGDHLDTIACCLEKMSQHLGNFFLLRSLMKSIDQLFLGEMHKGCCPKLFYKVHRPLLSG